MLPLSTLTARSKTEFARTLGGIFEHAPWVAEAVYRERPFASLDELHEAMCGAVAGAGAEQQLTLIRAHPDLAGKAALAGELTVSSSREQAGAGLSLLSEDEYRHFHALNGAYQGRFGFPFILAVRGHTKTSILSAFEERLPNSAEAERETALEEIYKIARFRLEALVGDV